MSRTAAAQPGLPIALPAPSPLAGLGVEESTPCARPFDSDDWLFSVDWEGTRCLLATGADGGVHLEGRARGLDERFPEVAATRWHGPPAVLDGTVCVLDREGRPDLRALCERVAAGASRPAVAFLATDILHLDGAVLTARPLQARLELLAAALDGNSQVQHPDHVVGHGRALATAASGRGLVAVIARRRAAPYRGGLASPDRLRIALLDRVDCVVLGLRWMGARATLVLGEWHAGRLVLAGTAPVDAPLVTRWFGAGTQPEAEAPADPRHAALGRVRWLRPRLVATVDRSDRPGPAGLPRWQLVGLRDDVDPLRCVRRTPVDPPDQAALTPARGFSPTVLSALPLDGAA